MTVCVATIYENGKVVCVTDRMLTLFEEWQWQMEPDDSKLFHLGASHAVMYAGDGSLALEVVRELVATLNPAGRDPLADLPTVATVADEYSKAWGRVKRQRIEREVLPVHKISFAQYEEKGKARLRAAVVHSIQEQIDGFTMPTLHAILAGVDEDGAPHLWIADGGVVSCVDIPGFAAIGIGQPHAYAEMMRGFTGRGMARGEAALLTYAAKKKADQTVGGVGAATNVFTLGPNALTYTPWKRTTEEAAKSEAHSGILVGVGTADQPRTTPPGEEALSLVRWWG